MCTTSINSKKFKNLLLIAALLFALHCSAQNKQWEMYNKIPKSNRIELKLYNRDVASGNGYCGEELTFVINSDYTVSFNCYSKMNLHPSEGGSSIDLNISGRGLLTWQSEKMVVQLNITESTPGGSYQCQTYHDKWSYGQVVGTQFDNYYYSFPRSEENYSYSFVLEYGRDEDGEFFKLIGNEIKLITYGNLRVIADYGGQNSESNRRFEYETKIRITNKPIRFTAEYKSVSELNADYSDEYGKWQWNDDRSQVYLESTSKNAYMILWNNDNNLSWGFQLPTSATGYRAETTDSGEALAYMMLSFDGASEQSFSFAKSGYSVFQYVQYDRFKGTLRRDASILNQIKDKRTLILNYKENGADKTAMFQLEGLEAIYNAITQ